MLIWRLVFIRVPRRHLKFGFVLQILRPPGADWPQQINLDDLFLWRLLWIQVLLSRR